MNNKLLEIKDLKIKFSMLDNQTIHVVNGINLTLQAGESLGIVGESGSGKSQFVLSIIGLLAKNAKVSGQINFLGNNLLSYSEEELNNVRGTDISMIFQDPMTSLNPYLKIITQMVESVEDKHLMSHKEATQKALDILKIVGITDPEKRLYSYPHQLSGGMRQRIMIAMAILSNPKLLIADEPTTALDVTIQSQILNLLSNLQKELKLSIIMITHDLGVVANLCTKIAIFYGGKIVELGDAYKIFKDPRHPYTRALLFSIPRLDQDKNKRLSMIPGSPQIMKEEPRLCVFRDRCSERFSKCDIVNPSLKISSNSNLVRCLKEE